MVSRVRSVVFLEGGLLVDRWAGWRLAEGEFADQFIDIGKDASLVHSSIIIMH